MMSAVYKVWVHVEMVDEEEDDYESVGEPQCIGEYSTEEQALSVAQSLESVPELLEACDHGER